MTKIETYEKVLRNSRKDSLDKLIENVILTLNTFTADDKMIELLKTLCSKADDPQVQKQSFICLSNTFELMYRSQLLLLVYNQTYVGKMNKYNTQITELEKKGGPAPLLTSKSP